MPFIETVSQKATFQLSVFIEGYYMFGLGNHFDLFPVVPPLPELLGSPFSTLLFIISSRNRAEKAFSFCFPVQPEDHVSLPTYLAYLLSSPTAHLIWGKGGKEEKKGEEEATIFSVCIGQNAEILFLGLSFSRNFLSIYCPEKYPFALFPFSPGQY